MIRLKTKVAGYIAGILFLTMFAQPSLALAQLQNHVPQDAVGSAKPVPSRLLFPHVNWDVDWAITSQRPGYPLLKMAKHFSVHPASKGSGAYHHHPQITFFHERLIAVWSNHPFGEDGPGQQVLGASSTDGEHWKSMGIVFKPRDDVRESTANGRSLIASPFVKIEDRLFAVAVVNDGVGYGSFNTPVTGTPVSKEKTVDFGKRIRRPHGFLIRELLETGDLGPLFWVGDKKPTPLEGFDELESTAMSAAELELLQQNLRLPLTLSPWDFGSPNAEIEARDGSLLCEPTTVQTDDGLLIRYLRDLNGSQKMYLQFSDDQGTSWTMAERTNIPDAPSKSVLGRTPSGLFFLIGNQVVSKRGTRRDPLTIGVSRDGTDFRRAFAIRWRTPKFQVPSQQQEDDGRGRGFQYPSFVIAKNTLWVIYSVNKEAIDVSRIDFSELFD